MSTNSQNKLDNFFRIHPVFYPHLPVRACIFINGRGLWYVKLHKNKMIIIENQRDGTDGDYLYKQDKITYDDDKLTIWKKYDQMVAIEMRLIYNSLAEKDERIRELETQMNDLIERVDALTNKHDDK